MVVRADSNHVDSTSSTDIRITKVGRVIRKLKLDEITQLKADITDLRIKGVKDIEGERVV
jgi:lipopolysaccharide/colanic/teichoic acid biosynthesis glycosyltransferase